MDVAMAARPALREGEQAARIASASRDGACPRSVPPHERVEKHPEHETREAQRNHERASKCGRQHCCIHALIIGSSPAAHQR